MISPMPVSWMPHPLLTVLEENGWNVYEEEFELAGNHRCHASQGKFHLIGEGESRGDAQVDVLQMVVELEWERCLEEGQVSHNLSQQPTSYARG